MKNKLFLGILLVLMGLFYIITSIFPDAQVGYVMNAYTVLFILGGYFGLLKRKMFGYILMGVSVVLYIKEYFPDFFKFVFPALAVVGGVIFILLGIQEYKNNKM